MANFIIVTNDREDFILIVSNIISIIPNDGRGCRITTVDGSIFDVIQNLHQIHGQLLN